MSAPRLPLDAGTATPPEARAGPPARAGAGFIALMAALAAMNAFAIDIVIPALGRISDEFALAEANDRQWAVLAVFLGMGVSQLLIGPIADRFGRRPAVFAAMAVALVGGLAAAFAQGFGQLIAARALQGVGTGGLRVVAMAITRDRFEGDEMARVASLTNAVFVLLILAAPILGQAIVEVASWRWVFAVLAVQALGTLAWFALAQPETLRPAHRRALSPRAVAATFAGIAARPAARRLALALGACFGAFVTFLASAQQILGEIYGLDRLLPLAFAILSLATGAGAWVNARAVGRLGAGRLTRLALSGWAASGLGGAAAFALAFDGLPPLWLFLAWGAPTIGLFGLLFGNLFALALAPMGDRAGSASSVVSAFATLCAVILAGALAEAFAEDVLPLALVIGAAGLLGRLALGREG